MKVYLINIETEEVDGPTTVRVNIGQTVKEFKQVLADMLNMDSNTIKVCHLNCYINNLIELAVQNFVSDL